MNPIIEFKDPNPLQIKYFGFSSLGQSLARYFYDCHGDEVYTKSQLLSQCQHVHTTNNKYIKFQSIPNNAIINSDRILIQFPFYIAGDQNAHILISGDSDDSSNGYEIGLQTVVVVFVLFFCFFFVFVYFLSFCLLRTNFEYAYSFPVIGGNANRDVLINKSTNDATITLADYRRADIFLSNEVLNIIIRIMKRKTNHINSEHSFRLFDRID